MAQADSKITLKLLIDARSQKVVFGEAGKEFIDFMFSLLTLPLGSVVKLLSSSTTPGSIGNLYESVQNLSNTYLIANSDMSSLLQPKISLSGIRSPLLLDTKPTTETKYYLCNNCKRNITTKYNNVCPSCSNYMTNAVTVVLPSMSSTTAANQGESVGGFVKGVVTYMITDNLEVTPLSAISSILLIERFSLKKDVQLEEKEVAIGIEEGLALLKGSLVSSTVLTDVFCSCVKKTNPTTSTS